MLPLFIVIEGVDGAGKSEAAKILASEIRRLVTPDVSEFRAPDGPVREIFLNRQGVFDSEAELLLMLAGHRWLISNKITPALNAGFTVILDRFTDSTISYQGARAGLTPLSVRLNTAKWIKLPKQPDFIIYLDADKDVREKRIISRGNLDYMDKQSREFRQLVAENMANCYLDSTKRYSIIHGKTTYPKPILITNNGDLEELREKLIRFIHKEIQKSPVEGNKK